MSNQILNADIPIAFDGIAPLLERLLLGGYESHQAIRYRVPCLTISQDDKASGTI
jgi:hypothetical protein